MRSFDFYDTLAVRMVAHPADVFSFVGERLNLPGFRAMRVAAEVKARRAAGGEVTFTQIYDHLPLPSDVKERAHSLELELEQLLLAPVTAVLSQFRTGDLIISDMYHEERFYREAMERLVPGVAPGAFLISGVLGVNKASGELWKEVAANYPAIESHLGDNILADVHQPRRNGLAAVHFDGAILNRYEKALAGEGGEGSIVAGVSRAARMSVTRSGSPPDEVATINATASVFGPLLHAFVHWIMRTCKDEGIQDVYFLARDGQLPCRMCKRLVVETGQELRCHYIYASRQALHLPGCQSIEDAELWLLENTPHLTMRIIAERACVPLNICLAAAEAHLAIGPDENIPQRDRSCLAKVIRDPLFVAAFMESVNRAFGPASEYYRAQGLGAGKDIAVVDVGWNGRLQRSLGSLLEKCGCRPSRILGLYLCLSRRLSNATGDDLRGFVADPERPKELAFFDPYRHIFEAALSADHATTLGFQTVNGNARPLLGEPYPQYTKRKIETQHLTLDAFTDALIAVGRAVRRPVVPLTEPVIKNFRTFLTQPTRENGLAFKGFLFVDGQSGTEKKPVVRSLKGIDFFQPKLDLGYWPEGTLSASGFGILAPWRRTVLGLRLRAQLAGVAGKRWVHKISSSHY